MAPEYSHLHVDEDGRTSYIPVSRYQQLVTAVASNVPKEWMCAHRADRPLYVRLVCEFAYELAKNEDKIRRNEERKA